MVYCRPERNPTSPKEARMICISCAQAQRPQPFDAYGRRSPALRQAPNCAPTPKLTRRVSVSCSSQQHAASQRRRCRRPVPAGSTPGRGVNSPVIVIHGNAFEDIEWSSRCYSRVIFRILFTRHAAVNSHDINRRGRTESAIRSPSAAKKRRKLRRMLG